MATNGSRAPADERRRFRYMLEEALAAEGRTGTRPEPVPTPAAGLEPSGAEAVRIAILGTPRSGNTWLRLVLGHNLDLTALPVHHPADLDWSDLPERAAIQLHWPRTSHLESLLHEAGVKVVTIIRHPFDVLLSVLRFAQTDATTAEWLWGEGGGEDALLDADPTAERFARWAVSHRARALLGVGPSWRAAPGVHTVSYESLLAAPEQEVTNLMQALEVTPGRPIAESLERYTPERVNRMHGFGHAWLASSGAWAELFPPGLLGPLRSVYGASMAESGYQAEPARVVEPEEATRRWAGLKPASAPLDDDDYEAQLKVVDPALSPVPPRSTLTCLVKVVNLGSARWPAALRHPRIRLGCRWREQGEGGAVVMEGRCLLREEVPVGGTCYQPATFPTPERRGSYRLQIDLLHEDVRWFDRAVDLPVEVR